MRMPAPARTATLAIALLTSSAACASLTPFTKIDGTDAGKLGRMNGSWTVINLDGKPFDGLQPPATIVFDTTAGAVSGFDGCNRFKGTYTFENGRLKARVAGTKMACTSDGARAVSARIADLFASGAEVVDTAIGPAHVLMLNNGQGREVRMGPTDKLQQGTAAKQ